MTVLENRVVSDASDREVADPRDPQVRLAALLDEGSVRLISPADRSGILSAMGRVEGVPVVAFLSDPRFQGGAMGSEGCEHIVHAYDVAVRERVPIIGVWHSGGARLAEGVESLHAVGRVFAAMTRASGVIPQLSVVVGPAAGGAAYGPALTDIVILADEGRIFVTGPDVVRSVTGEQIDMAALGGPEPHSKRSGVVHVVTKTETDAYVQAPAPGGSPRPPGPGPHRGRRGRLLRPAAGERRAAPTTCSRSSTACSTSRAWSCTPSGRPTSSTTLGRLGGRTVGVVANNPMRLGGCLDSISAEKAARFVRMCDAFGVPLVVLVDVPGYLPGVGQEHDGVVRRGAKLLHAFAEASVPRITLVTRKAYGGAYVAMNSRSLGATKVFGWPTTQIAVMGAVAAVRILKRRELAAASDEDRAALEAKLAEEHEILAGGLDRAIELGVVDEVIEPEETRGAIARVLATATPARGAHGNIPL